MPAEPAPGPRVSRRRDGGTVLPLLVLGVLLAATLLAASTAAGAALVARRQLAAVCDGAALAGASALDRSTVDTEGADRPPAMGYPLDPAGARRAVRAYLAAAGPDVLADVGTDRGTVTVRCRRTVSVPFGHVLGRPDGIVRTAVSRARTVHLS